MRVALCFLLIFALFGCKKTEIKRASAIPMINLLETTPLSLVQFDEQVSLTLAYEDGDGDLGHPHPDSLTLEVRDARLLEADYYFVPPLAPENQRISIKGNLNFKLNGTFLFGNGATEQTTFSIRIKDRSGNWSNTVITPTITIKRFP